MRTKLAVFQFYNYIEIRNFKNAAINNLKNVNNPSDGAWFSAKDLFLKRLF